MGSLNNVVAPISLSSSEVTGVLPENHGGTDISTYQTGDIIAASATNTLAKVHGNTSTTVKFLAQVGDGVSSSLPTWQEVVIGNLTADGLSVVGRPNATPGIVSSITATAASQFLKSNSAGTAIGFEALSSSDVTTALGYTPGTGTVVSVGVIGGLGSGINSTGGPITGSGNITLTLGDINPTSVNGLTLAPATGGFTIQGGNTFVYTLTVPSNATVSGTNTGDISIAGQNYLSLTGQVLTANAVNLGSANVTGITTGEHGGTGVANTGLTINLSLGSATSLMSSDLSGNATWGITYSATGGTGNIVSRDGNGNTFSNNFTSGTTSTSSTGGSINLNPNATRRQILTGTLTETYKLPNATQLNLGTQYDFNNNSTGLGTINDNSNSALTTVLSGGYKQVYVTNIGSPAGTWDWHSLLPNNVDWGTSTLTASSTSATFANVTAGTKTTTATFQMTTSPTNGYVMTTDGSGNGAWTNLAAIGVTSVSGTTNQITVTTNIGAAVVSLPNAIVTPGTLSSNGSLRANSSTTVNATGPYNLSIRGTQTTDTGSNFPQSAVIIESVLSPSGNIAFIGGVAGIYNLGKIIAASGKTINFGSLYYGRPDASSNVGTITRFATFYGDAPPAAAGTAGAIYQFYGKDPNTGSIAQAAYFDNLSVGFDTVDLKGTHTAIFSNNVSIGANSTTSLFNVGSSNQFQINTSGSLTTTGSAFFGTTTAATVTSSVLSYVGTSNQANITITGNSFDGTSTSDGVSFAMPHNAANNRQLSICDSAKMASSSTNATVRILPNSGAIDSIATDGSTILPLLLGNASNTTRINGSFVGINVAPINGLDVNGGIAVGSYAGNNTAPSGGMIINGQVGIKTTANNQAAIALQVGGSSGGTTYFAMDAASSSEKRCLFYSGGTGKWVWGLGGGTDVIDLADFGSGATRFAVDKATGYVGIGSTAPSTKLTTVETKTLVAGIGDGYSAALSLFPTYSGAFTVSRSNYLVLANPTVAASAVVTDAAVMYFDANAGTHKAVASAPASSGALGANTDAIILKGTLLGEIKVNLNGTIGYLPVMNQTNYYNRA